MMRILLLMVFPLLLWSVTEEQTTAIKKIVHIIDSHSIVTLPLHHSTIKNYSTSIKGISPLDFIEVILEDEKTHNSMKNILNSSIKSRVLNYKLSNGIKSRSENKNFLKILESFSEKHKKNFPILKKYIEEEQWGKFIRSLIFD